MEVFRRHGVGWSSHWFLWAVYKNLSCEVKVGEVLSDSFGVVLGLRQGCILSPLPVC